MIPSDPEELLIARLLLLEPVERAAELERACAEHPALRERLPEIMAALALAAESDDPTSLKDISARILARVFDFARGAEAPGTRIGHYKLLQEIGRGGFGVVWMAEQEGAIKRRVALKIIKAGMDTKEVIARFEAERQALALMDHPNIARVFDAGATETGRPYFVMELVRGVAITQYCDRNRLSVAARLRLFMTVCQAVQHAHQKGIIHRDLKPSNILVTLHDGVPVPKVIDFGIAKATMAQLTEKTLFTQFHAFMGTPAYTSPEQMEMSGLDVDTRSDIYSLGVLLYELLAGRPPFDAGELVKSGLEAMRRTIREIDPPRPSDRLTTLAGDERASVAQERATDAGRLPLLIHGDLDWIVMRCLEKDRTRRYETANGLARDIQRHLEDEPVVARPPSRVYALRKLIQRNRLLFVASAIITIVLVLGLIVCAWEAVRATRAERLASREQARGDDLLTFMIGDLRTQLAKVGRLDVLESVGDKAMDYFASLDPQHLTDDALARHSKALVQIGEIRMDQNRSLEAAAAFSEAYERAAALAVRHPQDGDIVYDRGQAEYWNGFVHWRRGEFAAADEWMSRYYATGIQLVSLDPRRFDWQGELASGLHNLAVVRQDQGDLSSARAKFGDELAILERLHAAHPDDTDIQSRMADVHSWLGGLAERQGEFKDSLRQYDAQALEYQRLAEADPKTMQKKYNQANAIMYQVNINMVTGQMAAARNLLKNAQDLLDSLVAFDPSNIHWLSASYNGLLKEAIIVKQQGNGEKAEGLLDRLLPELEKLSTKAPLDRSLALRHAMAWRLRAQIQFKAGRLEAASSATNAIKISEKLVSAGRATDTDYGECATDYLILGEIMQSNGDSGGSSHDCHRANELLALRIPGSLDWHLLDPTARAAWLLGRPAEASATIEKLTHLGYVPVDPWPTTANHASEMPSEPTRQIGTVHEETKPNNLS